MDDFVLWIDHEDRATLDDSPAGWSSKYSWQSASLFQVVIYDIEN